MEKEANFFIVCYDTGIDYHYEFDPEDPDHDDAKEYDYVPVTADTMKEALGKAADEMQQHIGKIYPIDFESTMKSNVILNDWKDIVEYINENNVDIDISEILNELSKDEDANVRISVAHNENTPVAVLETLAKDEDYFVRMIVAENENTPIAVLEELATDESPNVRIAVADNRNTPANVLEILSKDSDEDVRITAYVRLDKPVISASDLKEAKAEKDVRDAAAPKQEQKQKAQEHGLE